MGIEAVMIEGGDWEALWQKAPAERILAEAGKRSCPVF